MRFDEAWLRNLKDMIKREGQLWDPPHSTKFVPSSVETFIAFVLRRAKKDALEIFWLLEPLDISAKTTVLQPTRLCG